MRFAAPLALALCAAAPARAQVAADTTSPQAAAAAPADVALTPVGDARTDARVAVDVRVVGEVVSTDNADLLPTDESSQDAIDETDDRATFGSSALMITSQVDPIRNARLRAEGALFGAFGDGGSDPTLVLGEASAALTLVRAGSFAWSVTGGRQPFEIGGVAHDYVLAGTVDGFTSTLDFGHGLEVRGLLFDLFSPSEALDPSYRYSRPGRDRPSGQRGETNTYRRGVVLQAVDPFGLDGLDVRAFAFFASIGGSYIDGTGSDISRGGLIGNFRDRDHVSVLGARAAYAIALGDLGSLRPSFEFARSSGVDRKEVNAVDVDLGGNALGAALALQLDPASEMSIGLAGEWNRFDGAKYSVSGLEYQRGFVSLFGDRAGGLVSGRMAGWRPSAYVDADGVLHAPDDVARAAGTDMLHVGLSLGLADTTLRVGFWNYVDTRESAFDQSTLDFVDPPYGYSREEFAAQVRAGRRLGMELDVEVSQAVAEGFGRLYLRGGAFAPGDYYDAEISRVATPRAGEGFGRLGGAESATFWALLAGAEIGLSARHGEAP
ncbi:MAG: hypothetical protein H6697_03085 [Myxococcales bacterium]|nr:hypothetical protein [Myxococcales bacterium]MCB9520682.1 hypothetical protein [Myxococcales bacterium]